MQNCGHLWVRWPSSLTLQHNPSNGPTRFPARHRRNGQILSLKVTLNVREGSAPNLNDRRKYAAFRVNLNICSVHVAREPTVQGQVTFNLKREDRLRRKQAFCHLAFKYTIPNVFKIIIRLKFKRAGR